MDVSVIIPTRNKVETLVPILRGLARQTFPDRSFEVLVVDDRSTDGTEARVCSVDYPFHLRYLRLEPGQAWTSCLSAVRNHGLAAAAGEVVVFLDADVLPAPTLVAVHHQAVTNTGQASIGHVYGQGPDFPGRDLTAEIPPPSMIYDQLESMIEREPKKWRDGREFHYALWGEPDQSPVAWASAWGCNFAASRVLFERVGGYDESFVGWGWEDLELALRLQQAGTRFTLSRDAWGFHYPHSTARTAEALAENTTRLLAKHPYADVEAIGFLGLKEKERGALPVARRMLQLCRQGPAIQPAPMPREAMTALVGESRDRTAWFGSLPEVGDAPAWCSLPFLCQGELPPGAVNGLTGLCVPAGDHEWQTVVAVDYWRLLPARAMAFLNAELSRVADQVVFVATPHGIDHVDKREVKQHEPFDWGPVGGERCCRVEQLDLPGMWVRSVWRTGE